MNLAQFPRRRYTAYATPIEKLSNLSAALGGPTIYMKRDDLMDPVYTGKTMAGMIDLIQKGAFTKGENLLFLHTGGSPALFAYTDTFFGLKQPE